jgi:hypothetical protein
MCSGFASCEGCWCGPCYKPLGVRDFLIQKKTDKDGRVLEEEDKNERFKVAWVGDYLMIPFQCKVCHFQEHFEAQPGPARCK